MMMNGWTADHMQNMMGSSFAPFAWFLILLWFATWILIIVALVALIRWLWRKGER